VGLIKEAIFPMEAKKNLIIFLKYILNLKKFKNWIFKKFKKGNKIKKLK
jgi:hypothetical protein